ncbi:hypothetical protein [Streptomyces sp. NPDC048256]|uniref:hypothetical protein n=1 Tax=Streptomyces sp. NPDC048256 TaxID=3154613 RepID=UPI0033E61897
MAQLHAALTPEHFVSKDVPDLRKLRDFLSGDGLTWDLVEAVADVCFPCEPSEASKQRLQPARLLWHAARTHPTVVGADGEPAVSARELLEAQERTIAAYEELNRARRAFEISEQARQQALQVATVLFVLLGQTQAQVAELARRLDALQATGGPVPSEIETAHRRLDRAQGQEEDLRGQLARAEAEREKAQQVADHAARRIQALEAELLGLRGTGETRDSASAELPLPGLVGGQGGEDAALDEVEATLQKAKAVLDREHDAVQEAADDLLAWRPGPQPVVSAAGGPVVPGQVIREDSDSPDTSPPKEQGLSGTTTNNPATGDVQPGTVQATSSGTAPPPEPASLRSSDEGLRETTRCLSCGRTFRSAQAALIKGHVQCPWCDVILGSTGRPLFE